MNISKARIGTDGPKCKTSDYNAFGIDMLYDDGDTYHNQIEVHGNSALRQHLLVLLEHTPFVGTRITASDAHTPEATGADPTDPVFKRQGMWYHYDETWADYCGPFLTEIEARASVEMYGRCLDGKESPEPKWHQGQEEPDVEGQERNDQSGLETQDQKS